jgi:RNA polymerase sigma-70 factor (sigma-E family)
VQFDEFVEREFPALARLTYALTGDRQLAEEVLSDALLKVSARWRRASRAESPAAYARGVIVRGFMAHRSRLSTRRPVRTSDAPLPEATVSNASDDMENRPQVQQLLTRLTPGQRAAIVLRYVLDLPEKEIAEALGCSPDTVRSHLSQAAATLRLVSAGDDPARNHEGMRG